jgi:hypothetical protein
MALQTHLRLGSVRPRYTRVTMLSVAIAAAASGCASLRSSTPDAPAAKIPAPTPGPVRAVANFSGFLKDYSNLQSSPRHADTMYEQSRELAGYSDFQIGEIVVLTDSTMLGDELSEADKVALVTMFREELTQSLALAGRNALPSTPPKVATIRAAITQVAKSRRDASGHPVVTGAAGGPQIGGASVEAEIVDAATGKRLAAVVENDLVDEELGITRGLGPSRTKMNDPFYDARLVFRHWAARFALWISNADETATR